MTSSRRCSRRRAGTSAVLALALTGCSYPDRELAIPAPSPEAFSTTVYPILLRDCGFPACHGDPRRFFQLFGPGRTRLVPGTPPYAAVTPAELEQSYARARSMLSGGDAIEDALLLRKPLAVAAGGAGHEGDDSWDQAVYRSRDNPRYRALAAWALSVAQADGLDAGAP